LGNVQPIKSPTEKQRQLVVGGRGACQMVLSVCLNPAMKGDILESMQGHVACQQKPTFFQSDPFKFPVALVESVAFPENGGVIIFIFFPGYNPVKHTDPDGIISQQEHYARNKNNHPPASIPNYDFENPVKSFTDENGTTWKLIPENLDVYHEQGQSYDGIDPKNNNKYVSADGHQEGVYNQNGELATDPVNEGTYNFSDPNTNAMDHFFNAVLPYYKWGNSADDPTAESEHRHHSYTGPIPRPLPESPKLKEAIP
jgi:hypothetical protein